MDFCVHVLILTRMLGDRNQHTPQFWTTRWLGLPSTELSSENEDITFTNINAKIGLTVVMPCLPQSVRRDVVVMILFISYHVISVLIVVSQTTA